MTNRKENDIMANIAYMCLNKDINLSDFEETRRVKSIQGSKTEFTADWDGYNFLDEVITNNPDIVAIHIEEMEDLVYIVYHNIYTGLADTIDYNKKSGDTYYFRLKDMPDYIIDNVKSIIKLDDIVFY